MVSADYATRRPPPPSATTVFIHHEILPAAINASATVERGLSIAAESIRNRPLVAGCLMALLGYGLGRRKARHARRRLG
jgi:hypothetical protein